MGLGLLGAIEGAGKGVNQVAGILMKDELESLRVENLEKIKSKATEKAQDFTATQNKLKLDTDVSEGLLDRNSRNDIANISAKAKKAAAEYTESIKNNKPTTAKKRLEELKEIFPNANEKTLANEVYSLGEKLLNPGDNSITFTGITSGGKMGPISEFAQPTDEEGKKIGSRRVREFKNLDAGLLESKGADIYSNAPPKESEGMRKNITSGKFKGKIAVYKNGKWMLENQK